MAGNTVWNKINLQIKLTLKDVAFKENAVNWQFLRYDDDYSIVYTRYSTSDLKKVPQNISLLIFKEMLEKVFRPA